MRLPFDPARILGHIFFASLGAGLGMVLTFVIAWQLSGNAASLSAGLVTSTLLIGFLVFLPLSIPAAVALLAVGWLVRARFPTITPGGGGMILLLGTLGIVIEVLLSLIIGVGENSELGRYMMLCTGIGGALCGIIIGWRLK